MPKTLCKLSKKMISRKNIPDKLWVDKVTKYGGIFKTFARKKKTLKFTRQ